MIKIRVTHCEPDNDRAVEIWLQGYAAPIQLVPGQEYELAVDQHTGAALIEGEPVHDVETKQQNKESPVDWK